MYMLLATILPVVVFLFVPCAQRVYKHHSQSRKGDVCTIAVDLGTLVLILMHHTETGLYRDKGTDKHSIDRFTIIFGECTYNTGGSRFEPWFGLGSYRWILGEFSSGVYPTVSHLLVH